MTQTYTAVISATVAIEHAIDKDLQQHIEDDINNAKVNAIRDGKLVEVSWSELTDDERRAAHENLFRAYELD